MISSGKRRIHTDEVLRRYPFIPAFAIMLLLLALNGMAEPNSLSIGALKGVISTYLALVFLAIAQTFVVYTSDIDLSVGATLSVVNVSVVVFINHFGNGSATVLLACLLGVIIGALCGLLNGIIVAGLRLQAIVATFATSIFLSGVALIVLPVAGLPAPSSFWKTYGGRFLEIPFVFWVVILLLIALVFISKTRLMIQLLAVGNGQQTAFQSGLEVTKIRVTGYVLCGVFSALAALCITGDTASGDPLVGGAMTLYSVAAVVLGGTALSGGAGSTFGSAIGAIIIGLISSFVFYIGTPSEWQNLATGASILGVLLLGVQVSRRINR